MSEAPETLAQQIAALEEALKLPLPATTRAQIEQDLRALHEWRGAQPGDAAIQGTANVSGTLHGNAIGVNLGSVQHYVGAAPPTPGDRPATKVPPEAINDQRALLVAHRRTLTIYLKQLATHSSANAPPSVEQGIREARAAIGQAKTALRKWGVAVDDHPDDEAAPL
jgi:hypothetical protein